MVNFLKLSFKTQHFFKINIKLAKDFIKNLLVLNPKKRMTAKQCLSHPFLSGSAGEKEISMESMREYTSMRKKIKEEQKMED